MQINPEKHTKGSRGQELCMLGESIHMGAFRCLVERS